MENTQHPIANWIPIKLIEKEKKIYFEWLYVSDKKFAEPFFDETIAKCKSHPNNSSRFKILSTVQNLIDWSNELVFVELKSLVFHVSRCGSTMLSQSLATSSENILVSEAPLIDQVLRSGSFSLQKKAAILKSILTLLGQKRFPEQKNLIIKLDAWNIFEVDFLRSIFPNVPFALLYRDPGEVLRSHQKMMGMHMVPHLIPPAVFGITSREIQQVSFQQYGALVLAKYFQCFIDFYVTDKNVVILNYNDGMKNVVERFLSLIAVDYSNDELNLMLDRLKKHSKDGSADFTGDSYKNDVLAVDLTEVNLLHEKLNASFIEDLAG